MKSLSAGLRRVTRGLEDADAFTLVELMVVIFLITMLLGVTVIVYFTTMKRTDAKAGVEMVKQDLRKVVMMADAGNKTNGERDRYRIEFHYVAVDNPPNAYKILKQTYNGSWATSPWTTVAAERFSTFKAGGNNWIQFSNSSETKFKASGMNNLSSVDPGNGDGTCQGMTFISKGSVIQKDTAGDTVITITGGGMDYPITISETGSVSD